MSSYLLDALGASTTCPGCLCRDRVRRYPSDLTDAQWKILQPHARQVMDQLRRATGRPMVHDLRAVLDAVGYVVRNGIEWRALPMDFPPWEAVYAFFQRWSQRGLPQLLVDRLRARLRTGVGREVQPTAAIMDSQSVKAADTVGATTRGFDNGKKINGRKRHIAVDTEGFLLAAVVTAANIGDRAGAKLLIITLLNTCTRLRLLWADAGYDGKAFTAWAHAVARITVQVVKRTEAHVFTVLPRRWVVERSLAWLLRYRRLARDYERRPDHHEAMVYWATIWIMTRRLARRSTDPPLQRRWGQPRPRVSPTPTLT
ncbi:IS5 family transposase [Dactylosporangium darangshiense]|uniref:IS5 family transposase n=1 Tax=Dactylosporangium darangshiense TaxID=579108 RepID=A0ABP8DHY6_9ACTN